MSEFISQSSQLWINYFGLIVIQNTLFLGIVFLFLFIFRNVSAQTKYLIGMLGVIKLLLPPLIPIGIFSGRSDEFSAIKIAEQLIPVKSLSNVSESISYSSLTSGSLDWIGLLFVIWIAGILIYFLIFASRTLHLILVLRNAIPITNKLHPEIFDDMNIEIYYSDRITMPMTTGILPGRIFVPKTWDEWNRNCQKIVIQHEMTHMRRHDSLAQNIQLMAQAIFFFHPLVFLLNNRIKKYREMACDDASIRIGKNTRIEYSKCLTEIAEKAIWNPIMCQSVSAFYRQKSELFNRIRYQIKEETMFSISKRKMLLILSLLALCAFPFSWHISHATVDSQIVEYSKGNQAVKIVITSESDIQINDIKTSLANFKTEMDKIKQNSGDQIFIQLKVDHEVSMHVVFKAQKILRELNLRKVMYSDDEERGLDLMLPPLGAEKKLDQIPDKDIMKLKISAEGKVTANNMFVEIADLDRFIKESLKKNDKQVVTIDAEENTSYESFVIVLDKVKKGGAKRVGIYDMSK